MITHHAKRVSGNAKHAQISTAAGVLGLREAISHRLNLPTQSKLDALAMNMQLAASEAKERTKSKMVTVRGQILSNISTICRKATASLNSKNLNEQNDDLATGETHAMTRLDTIMIRVQTFDILWTVLVQH